MKQSPEQLRLLAQAETQQADIQANRSEYPRVAKDEAKAYYAGHPKDVTSVELVSGGSDV